jgi:hypothetical protein
MDFSVHTALAPVPFSKSAVDAIRTPSSTGTGTKPAYIAPKYAMLLEGDKMQPMSIRSPAFNPAATRLKPKPAMSG